MKLITRTQNNQCTIVRMVGSFRMFQEDWTQTNKKKEKKINQIKK